MEVERILSCETAEVGAIELGVDLESCRAVFHSPWHGYLDSAVCDGPASVEKPGTIDLIEFVREIVVRSVVS